MGGVWLLVLWGVVSVSGSARDYTDLQVSDFPKLFHLDDYECCLASSQGLYCLGDFLTKEDPNAEYSVFPALQEYASESRYFNRTYIHRGFCVSARCPSTMYLDNTTYRFEQCVARSVTRYGLQVELTKLDYCKSRFQIDIPKPLDTAEMLFIFFTSLLVIMNVVGTVYDMKMGDVKDKNNYLMAWSVKSNWNKLTADDDKNNPRMALLACVNGMRVVMWLILIMTHTGMFHLEVYLFNPRFVEKMAFNPVVSMVQNGTSMMQSFVFISSFLLTWSQLGISNKNLSFFKLLFKRLIRVTPLQIFVVGFAATLWLRIGDGPLWDAVVGVESSNCRYKFWSQLLYFSNFYKPDDICLYQTWYLAVDFQLQIITIALVVYLIKKSNRKAIIILSVLFILSHVALFFTVYFFQLDTLIFRGMVENIRSKYYQDASFHYLYTAPWGNIQTSILGILIAFLIQEMTDKGFDSEMHPVLGTMYRLNFPAIFVWTMSGAAVRHITSRLFRASYVSMERLVIGLLTALGFVGACFKYKSVITDIFAWKYLRVLGRLTYAVMMVHWCVLAYIIVNKPYPITTTLLDVVTDTTMTSIISYGIAVPLSVMLELPMQRFFNVLFFRK